MRHFLRAACAPRALARSMSARPAVALLVALRGAPQRFAPAQPRTLPGAVLVAAITSATDAHLLRTAPATVQPIRLLACSHAPGSQHWTTPRIAGIKTRRTRLYAARACRRPGGPCQECARAFAYPACGLKNSGRRGSRGRRETLTYRAAGKLEEGGCASNNAVSNSGDAAR